MKDGFGKPTIIRATEISLKKKNGEPFIVEVSAASVMNNQKEIEHVVSVWVDITERKKVERKLIKLNENLEAAQLISKMGSWEWDMATNSVTWSEELCHMLWWNTNDPIPQFPDLERFYTPGSWKRSAPAGR